MDGGKRRENCIPSLRKAPDCGIKATVGNTRIAHWTRHPPPHTILLQLYSGHTILKQFARVQCSLRKSKSLFIPTYVSLHSNI